MSKRPEFGFFYVAVLLILISVVALLAAHRFDASVLARIAGYTNLAGGFFLVVHIVRFLAYHFAKKKEGWAEYLSRLETIV